MMKTSASRTAEAAEKSPSEPADGRRKKSAAAGGSGRWLKIKAFRARTSGGGKQDARAEQQRSKQTT